MLPLILLFWLAGEIATYLWLGREIFGTTWPVAGAMAAGGVLLARLNINALTWLSSRRFASPAPRMGAIGFFRLMLQEFAAFILTFIFVLPFERLWMPADRLPANCGRTPILLVHGYGCSRGVWWLMRRRLEAAGHVVASVSLFPPAAAIGRQVAQLKDRIEAVCSATGSKQVILLTHSMGGLVARSYLARHGIAHVAKLLTLSAPHQGSELARLGFGGAARDMVPGNLWLRDMASEEIKLPAISLRNPYDNYVMPQDNQRHPQMQDIELPPVGHLAALHDPRIARLLIDLLENSP